MQKFFFVQIVLIPFYTATYFDTLSEIIAYAKKVPTAVLNEWVEPFYPRFNSLHHKIPQLTENWLQRIGLQHNTLIDDFKRLLHTVAEQRELEGFLGDFVQKVYIEEETKWYIWCGLHGAFQSLVRGLTNLNKNKLIHDNLVLTDPSIYLVFNGDMINYGPYQIETLQTILKLYEKNPKQVFLIRGNSEQDGIWQKTNFKNELQTRIGTFGKEIPLEREITALFNTFAWAVYLLSTEGDVVRISFYDHHLIFQEQEWGGFFSRKETETGRISYMTRQPWNQHLKDRITTHWVKDFPYTIPALAYSENGPTHTWSGFSAPLRIFQAYYNFYEDILLVLTTGRFFSTWLLTLYTEDYEKPKGFIRAREFEVATGKEIFTADPIKRIEDLTEKLEFAKINQKRLETACKMHEDEKKGEISSKKEPEKTPSPTSGKS